MDWSDGDGERIGIMSKDDDEADELGRKSG